MQLSVVLSIGLSIGLCPFYRIVKGVTRIRGHNACETPAPGPCHAHDWTASVHSSRPKQRRPHQTTPEGTPTTTTPTSGELRDTDLLRAAFRDVHGASLHGFAVLISLGDRSRASSAAGDALAEGAGRAAELRHPERAAAWLRARVLLALRRTSGSRLHSLTERRAVLLQLGMTETSAAALERLSLDERAALVAGSVERFSNTDLATILRHEALASQRILRSARQHYLRAASRLMHDLAADAMPGGDIAQRVLQAADRAIGRPVGPS